MDKKYILVDINGEQVNIGDSVVDFRGDDATILKMYPPHREGTSGKVLVREEDGSERMLYAKVFGLTFVEEDINYVNDTDIEEFLDAEDLEESVLTEESSLTLEDIFDVVKDTLFVKGITYEQFLKEIKEEGQAIAFNYAVQVAGPAKEDDEIFMNAFDEAMRVLGVEYQESVQEEASSPEYENIVRLPRPLSDLENAIMTGVVGQCSDGIWENSSNGKNIAFWSLIDYPQVGDSELAFKTWDKYYNKFYGDYFQSPSDVLKYVANKINSIIRIYKQDWGNNSQGIEYFHSYGSEDIYPTEQEAKAYAKDLVSFANSYTEAVQEAVQEKAAITEAKYAYRGQEYNTESEVDEAIEDAFASEYNNKPVPQEVFEYEWEYEVMELEDKEAKTEAVSSDYTFDSFTNIETGYLLELYKRMRTDSDVQDILLGDVSSEHTAKEEQFEEAMFIELERAIMEVDDINNIQKLESNINMVLGNGVYLSDLEEYSEGKAIIFLMEGWDKGEDDIKLMDINFRKESARTEVIEEEHRMTALDFIGREEYGKEYPWLDNVTKQDFIEEAMYFAEEIVDGIDDINSPGMDEEVALELVNSNLTDDDILSFLDQGELMEELIERLKEEYEPLDESVQTEASQQLDFEYIKAAIEDFFQQENDKMQDALGELWTEADRIKDYVIEDKGNYVELRIDGMSYEAVYGYQDDDYKFEQFMDSRNIFYEAYTPSILHFYKEAKYESVQTESAIEENALDFIGREQYGKDYAWLDEVSKAEFIEAVIDFADDITSNIYDEDNPGMDEEVALELMDSDKTDDDILGFLDQGELMEEFLYQLKHSVDEFSYQVNHELELDESVQTESVDKSATLLDAQTKQSDTYWLPASVNEVEQGDIVSDFRSTTYYQVADFAIDEESRQAIIIASRYGEGTPETFMVIDVEDGDKKLFDKLFVKARQESVQTEAKKDEVSDEDIISFAACFYDEECTEEERLQAFVDNHIDNEEKILYMLSRASDLARELDDECEENGGDGEACYDAELAWFADEQLPEFSELVEMMNKALTQTEAKKDEAEVTIKGLDYVVEDGDIEDAIAEDNKTYGVTISVVEEKGPSGWPTVNITGTVEQLSNWLMNAYGIDEEDLDDYLGLTEVTQADAVDGDKESYPQQEESNKGKYAIASGHNSFLSVGAKSWVEEDSDMIWYFDTKEDAEQAINKYTDEKEGAAVVQFESSKTESNEEDFVLYIRGKRDGYGIDQVGDTLNIREMIEVLEEYEEDVHIYLNNDNGYTYGSITYDDIYEDDDTIYIIGKRNGYGIDQVGKTLNIREMIEVLEEYDEDLPIYLINDNGYTYGSITYDDIYGNDGIEEAVKTEDASHGFDLIADVEREDGSITYGVNLGNYGTWEAAREALKSYKTAEGPTSYFNFEIVDYNEVSDLANPDDYVTWQDVKNYLLTEVEDFELDVENDEEFIFTMHNGWYVIDKNTNLAYWTQDDRPLDVLRKEVPPKTTSQVLEELMEL